MFSKQLFLQIVLFQTVFSANDDNFLPPLVPEPLPIQLKLNVIENKFHQLEERISQKVEQKEEELKFHERLIENQKELIKGIAKLQESHAKLEGEFRKMGQKQEEELKFQRELILEIRRTMEETQTKVEKGENKCFDSLSKNEVTSPPKSCCEIQKSGYTKSGIYTIKSDPDKESFKVWCDLTTKGGGWIYVINRFDNSLNFNLTWSDYKTGFGNLSHEFWLGLENVYTLTGDNPNELLIELVDSNKTKTYAHYKQFSLGNEIEGYTMKLIKGHDGDADDCLGCYEGMKFSTWDRDQDLWPTGNCAAEYGGGFWYEMCRLCGLFTGTVMDNHNRIVCSMFPLNVLKEVRMMIR